MTEKNRILFLTQDYFVGGAEIVLRTLIERLDRKRFDCTVCCYRDSGDVAKLLQNTGVSIRFLRRKRGLASQLHSIVRDERITTVYVNTYKLLREAAILKGLSCRVIYHMHHLLKHTHRDLTDTQKKDLLKLILCVSDRVIACSKAVKNQFNFCEAKDMVTVIYNGIDTESYYCGEAVSLLRRYNFQSGTKTIAAIGRIEPKKGQRLFIRACAKVRKVCDNAIFLIIGQVISGHFMDVMRNDIRRYSLTGDIILTGFRNDLRQLLSEIDVVVSPSQDEAFNLSLLEGMAAGRAVVATATGGNLELIRDGRNGLLTKPGSSGSLAAAIIRLIQDDRLRQRIGESARREAGARYGIRKFIGKIESVLST